ncbi:MAG: hypothetical protein ACRDIY_03095 [Chloroflexota bacterium]
MSERFHRTQLLLRPDQHEALIEIARRENRSISDVVREMIGQQLDSRAQARSATIQRQLEALERIRQHREAILAERGGKPIEIDIADMINQMREERDEEILGSIADQRD